MTIPDEIVEKARDAYDDAYEAEYLAHGVQGNNLVAMRAALSAVLSDLTATAVAGERLACANTAGSMAERPYDNEPEFSAVLAVEAAIRARRKS